jgi:hypothetical protein
MFIGKRGQVNIVVIIGLLVTILAISLAVPIFGSMVQTIGSSGDVTNCINLLENKWNYAVFAGDEYNALIIQINAIKAKTDNLPANPASETTAAAAVANAEAAVTAAQLAAAKVDLFNSAEVFLFPDTTNVTITMTAGNTNVWGDWVEAADSTAVTLSSKFSASAGYINDMYIYDHSAVDKLYSVELAYGATKTTLARTMWHTSFKDAVQIKSRRVPVGETIYYRMMCSGANGANAKVGFRYFYE